MQNYNTKFKMMIPVSNFKKSFAFFVVVFSFSFFIFNLSTANAARLYFEEVPNEVLEGDVFEVSVMLDAEGDSLNAIEGTLLFSEETLTLRSIRDDNSIIPLWIIRPKHKDDVIIFSGIIPGGFFGVQESFNSFPQPGRVFSLLFEAQNIGETLLSFQSAQAFRNTEQAVSVELDTPSTLFSITPPSPQPSFSQRSPIFILLLLFTLGIFVSVFGLLLWKKKYKLK